jgi:hypothetical protein
MFIYFLSKLQLYYHRNYSDVILLFPPLHAIYMRKYCIFGVYSLGFKLELEYPKINNLIIWTKKLVE